MVVRLRLRPSYDHWSQTIGFDLDWTDRAGIGVRHGAGELVEFIAAEHVAEVDAFDDVVVDEVPGFTFG